MVNHKGCPNYSSKLKTEHVNYFLRILPPGTIVLAADKGKTEDAWSKCPGSSVIRWQKKFGTQKMSIREIREEICKIVAFKPEKFDGIWSLFASPASVQTWTETRKRNRGI